MICKGGLMPNVETVDLEGRRQALWDFRQKSHVVLVRNPVHQTWQTEVSEKAKIWDWLNVRFVKSDAPDLEPGAYVIDRYGRLIRFHPTKEWNLNEIEKDFLYYESCNC